MSETDRRGGAYAPPPDDYETFDARDAEQDRRGWLFLGAALVVFVLFVAVVWNTFQLGVRDRDSSPVIAADAEPYRVPPDDPGGYQAPDQDLSVNRLREGAGDTDPDAAPAAPRTVTEEPVEPPARDMPAARVETADADAMDSESGGGSAAAEAPAREEPEAPRDPEPRIPEPRLQPEPAQPASLTSGPWVVQIAAFRTQQDIDEGIRLFVTRFPELARGREPDVQRADLGDQGVFYRLRIAGFATREDAAAYCAALEAGGQACLVARR